MKAIVYALMLVHITLGVALAQAPTPEWYANNPEELNNALARCRDPLGGIKLTPECKTVERGLYLFAGTTGYAHLKARQARAEAMREAQWRSDPNSLLNWLQMCAAIPQDDNAQRFAHCPEAKMTADTILREKGK